MKNKAIFGITFAALITVACGEVKKDNTVNGSPVQSESAEQQSDLNFELAGLGDASCQLTYQLVKKVTGLSSASVFYEQDSGNLVSRGPLLDSAFGGGCLSYCTTEFQSLQTRYGAERVLLRNCNFERNIATASVKGRIESYGDGRIKGFACKYGNEASVDVEILLGYPARPLYKVVFDKISQTKKIEELGPGPETQTVIGRIKANEDPSDEADLKVLGSECATKKAVHRFTFDIPPALIVKNDFQPIFVRAIDIADKTKSYTIGDSGSFRVRIPPAKPEPYATLNRNEFLDVTSNTLPDNKGFSTNSEFGCNQMDKLCVIRDSKLRMLISENGVNFRQSMILSYAEAEAKCKALQSRKLYIVSEKDYKTPVLYQGTWRIPTPAERIRTFELFKTVRAFDHFYFGDLGGGNWDSGNPAYPYPQQFHCVSSY